MSAGPAGGCRIGRVRAQHQLQGKLSTGSVIAGMAEALQELVGCECAITKNKVAAWTRVSPSDGSWCHGLLRVWPGTCPSPEPPAAARPVACPVLSTALQCCLCCLALLGSDAQAAAQSGTLELLFLHPQPMQTSSAQCTKNPRCCSSPSIHGILQHTSLHQRLTLFQVQLSGWGRGLRLG